MPSQWPVSAALLCLEGMGVTISVVFPQTASMTLLSPNIIRCHWFLLPVMPSHNQLYRLLFKTQPGVQG